MFEHIWAILVGRMIYGLGVGLISIAMPRSMEETVPEHTVGTYGGLYCLSFATAVLTAYLLALILPPDTDTQALIETQKTLWFFGMPLLIFTIMFALQQTIITQEPIKFLLTNQKNDEAVMEIKKVYTYADSYSKAFEIAAILNRSCQKSTSKITVKEAFLSRKYRTGSLVAIMVMTIHELSACVAIMLQTNDIISQM